MSLRGIELVVFDLAGTTIDDEIESGVPLMIYAMNRAFSAHDLQLTQEIIHEHRGKEKKEAIVSLLSSIDWKKNHSISEEEMVDKIFETFVQELNDNVGKLKELEGVCSVFEALRLKSIKIAVGSGFPEEVVQKIVECTGWRQKGLVDFVASAESVGAGRHFDWNSNP